MIEPRLQAVWSALTDARVPFNATADSLTVRAESEDGFDACVAAVGSELIVAFGELWHEHFRSPERALGCFLFGLTDQCRLVSVFRGTTECRATVQRLIDGDWVATGTTGLLLPPFWRRRSVRLRSNARLSISRWRALAGEHVPWLDPGG